MTNAWTMQEGTERFSKIRQKHNKDFFMGYAFNLCKFHIYNVPYNHNIAEEGMKKDIFL